MLAISCASSTSPPPLPRRSNTIPFAPCRSSLSTASRTSPWAPALNVASATTPSLMPFTVRLSDATTGSETIARVIVTVRVLRCADGPVSIFSVTLVPGSPLIRDVAFSESSAVQAAAADADDQFARLQASPRGRRGVEHPRDQQSPPSGLDDDADPREVRRTREFAEFRRGQVVREAVVQARDDARDRGVAELARGDRAVVVVDDALDRFVDHGPLRRLDERAPQERRQVFGVSAEVQPGRQQDRQQRGEDGRQRRSAGGARHRDDGKRRRASPRARRMRPGRSAWKRSSRVRRWRRSPHRRWPRTASRSTRSHCRARAR